MPLRIYYPQKQKAVPNVLAPPREKLRRAVKVLRSVNDSFAESLERGDASRHVYAVAAMQLCDFSNEIYDWNLKRWQHVSKLPSQPTKYDFNPSHVAKADAALRRELAAHGMTDFQFEFFPPPSIDKIEAMTWKPIDPVGLPKNVLLAFQKRGDMQHELTISGVGSTTELLPGSPWYTRGIGWQMQNLRRGTKAYGLINKLRWRAGGVEKSLGAARLLTHVKPEVLRARRLLREYFKQEAAKQEAAKREALRR